MGKSSLYLILALNLLILSGCELGLFVPRTANVPMLDSTKKADFTAGLGAGRLEIQHNHVLGNRFVLQNNFMFRLEGSGVNGMGEIGLGHFLHKDYSKILMFGIGKSYQNFEYLLSSIDGGSSSYVTITAEDQYHFYTMYSTELRSEPSRLCMYFRNDVCKIYDYVEFGRNVTYTVPDIGFQLYNRRFRTQFSFGLKYGFSLQPDNRPSDPLNETYVYTRLRLRL